MAPRDITASPAKPVVNQITPKVLMGSHSEDINKFVGPSKNFLMHSTQMDVQLWKAG
jgi:hypothetical protein